MYCKSVMETLDPFDLQLGQTHCDKDFNSRIFELSLSGFRVLYFKLRMFFWSIGRTLLGISFPTLTESSAASMSQC